MDYITDAIGLTVLMLISAALITMLGGFIKGAVGFAMPLVMISGMGTFIDPQLVVAGIVLPIVTTNIMQVARAGVGAALSALWDYRIYVVIVCVMIVVSAQFLTRIPADMILVILGVPVVLLCLVQLAGWQFRIAPRARPPFAVLAGTIAGTLGGLAGTWGPPTVLYLLAVDTPKARQMAVQGVIYGFGSVALLAGHLKSGVLSAATVPFSAALIAPALVGMWLGFRLGDRLDQEKFRKLTLIVLVVAGLNLIRRGLYG